MQSPAPVIDHLSNVPENLVQASKIVGRSPQRQKVFMAIYKGKMRVRTVEYVAETTGLSKKRVLDLARPLVVHGLVKQVKDQRSKRTAYERIPHFISDYTKILKYAANSKLANRVGTKRSSRSDKTINLKINVNRGAEPEFIGIEEFDVFSSIKGIKTTSVEPSGLREQVVKEGFQKVIGEAGSFNDWGGEKNDLFTTKITLKNKKLRAALAFKGRSTKPPLTPKKMGKNGDQIERLFDSPADIYFVVFHGVIDQSVISWMETCAVRKSLLGQKVYYGVVDGVELAKVIEANNDQFYYK